MKIVRLIFVLLFTVPCFAISPEFWEENTQEQFADGDPQSVSISSDGELFLAPQLKKIYQGTDSVIWKIVRDSRGNLYAATGNEGRIMKIDGAGKGTVVLDTQELEVQAMIVDKNDNLFAATTPDGKIYRINREGKSEVYFDPEDRYIWSLAIDESGNLYAGTGDQGKIYKIRSKESGVLLVDTAESNITSLAWDKAKKLLAGSDKNGILYSIDATGKAFVLYDSDLQQITSIYSNDSGEVYFGAIAGIAFAPGIKTMQETPSTTQPTPATTTTATEAPGSEPEPVVEVTTSVDMSSAQFYPNQPQARTQGAAELFRINTDGLIESIYTLAEDQILDIVDYKDERILISTGKKAKLITLEKNKQSTILLRAPEEQILTLLAFEGTIWAATANPGNIYQLVEKHSSSGTYFSDVKDTRTSSVWGQIKWKANLPEGSSLTLSTRTGNTKTPDDTWSDWQNAGNNMEGASIKNPRARFIQWKADFKTNNSAITPTLRHVSIAFLQQNIRPEIVSIKVHPAGAVFRKNQIYPQESFAGLSEEAVDSPDAQEAAMLSQPGFDMSLGKKEYKKGLQTITWSATDQNQDKLKFRLQYRREDEKNWKLLAEDLSEKVFAWDTETMPDGTYLVRVGVDDSGSNPKEYVLENRKDSNSFDIDNSAPTIEVVKNDSAAQKIILEVRAQDRFSSIKNFEYSIIPGEWVSVFPIDSINDSKSELYRIELPASPEHERVIIFKVMDRVNNVSSLRHVIR